MGVTCRCQPKMPYIVDAIFRLLHRTQGHNLSHLLNILPFYYIQDLLEISWCYTISTEN